jgi:signal transduction histidine kinase/CheY-like chemotaxis protein
LKPNLYTILFFLLFTGYHTTCYSQDTAQVSKNSKFEKLLDSSNYYYNQGKYKKSYSLNQKALDIAYELDNPFKLHQAYRYLAYDLWVLKDTILSLEHFKKAESYAKLSKNDTATALTYMDLANVFASKKDYKKALIYHDRSINLFNKIKDSAGLAKAQYNAIITALDAKEFPRALIHIQEAKKLKKYDDNTPFNEGLNSFLAEYYLGIGDYKNAEKHILKVIKKKGIENFPAELEYAYQLYSEILFNLNRYKEAYLAEKKYVALRDLNERLNNTEDLDISEKFKLSQYRESIKAIKLQNQLQKERLASRETLNKALALFSFVGLLLFIALYAAYSKRKRLILLLQQKNKEYLKAKEESERLSRAKIKFFSTVSHELRTPLYGVIGLTSILLEDEKLKSHEKDLKALKFSADYLLALINDVLQINKLESENTETEFNSFNLKELISTIISSFEYICKQNNNQVIIEIDPAIPPLIRGNSVRLSQILMNLIGNACKFTENGTITVSVTKEGIHGNNAAIKFTIKDTGIGIAKDKQQFIFEEFSQGTSLNYNYQGTGLGLPIVKRLLELSNSQIFLESEPGKGSSFWFTLSFEIIKDIKEVSTLGILDTKVLENKKILIVEDNKINQMVTRKILEKYKVICDLAVNGEEAIEKVKNNSFDLVLMDINMPVLNGMESTKEIRKFNTSIPIIALTAVEIEELRHKIFESGMNDIIVKPYDVKQFIQTIIKNLVHSLKVS